jgi:hypothetical protein
MVAFRETAFRQAQGAPNGRAAHIVDARPKVN